MTVIVHTGEIRRKAKEEERARICTVLALNGQKLKGAERRGFMKAATLVARLEAGY